MGGAKGRPSRFARTLAKRDGTQSGIYERFFRSFDHGGDYFYLIMIFLSNYFVVDNNFFIFVESIRKSSLND